MNTFKKVTFSKSSFAPVKCVAPLFSNTGLFCALTDDWQVRSLRFEQLWHDWDLLVIRVWFSVIGLFDDITWELKVNVGTILQLDNSFHNNTHSKYTDSKVTHVQIECKLLMCLLIAWKSVWYDTDDWEQTPMLTIKVFCCQSMTFKLWTIVCKVPAKQSRVLSEISL